MASFDVWTLVGRFISTVPPGLDLDRYRDVFTFLAELQALKDGGEYEAARDCALVLGEACEQMPVTHFYALARTAWQARASGPRGGRRFWRSVLTRPAGGERDEDGGLQPPSL